ncbi:MAG: AAA family ATPase, partial [Tannerella sp.]|nr:AAA family ATPase [Tannerella sp.]
MIKFFLEQKIAEFFPHKMTAEQTLATSVTSDFLTSNIANNVLIFKGFAGTGKTTLLSTLVRVADSLQQKVVLLAPTGRAAKVFSEYSSHPAFTIHKKIYRLKTFSDEGVGFSLAPNSLRDTVFIVDEASMIANEETGALVFGSGRLLDDLVRYVYSGENCRLILSGDTAQLPPVGLSESPALNADYLKKYNLKPVEIILTEVVRQESHSGILINATDIRNALQTGQTSLYPSITLSGYADIRKIEGADLIEELSSAYGRDGIDDTIVICRSNRSAVIYNTGIRNRILYREEEISSGDRLMVVKNSYLDDKTKDEPNFIANGEIIQVIRVRRYEELYGFRFCNILARLIDYDVEIELKIILDTLRSESPALTKEQSDKLYAAIAESYSDVSSSSGRLRKIKADPYYNAIRVKYAYAVTCHKAQGGQWS